MARLRKNKNHKIELFPFLSVLICTIGVLTLILISSVLGQVDAVVDTADKYRGIVRQLDKINSQISQWQSAVASKKERVAKLEAALNELEQLLGELGLIKSPEEYQGIFHALKEARKNIVVANDNIDHVRIEIKAADPDGVYSGNATPEAIQELAGVKKKLNAILRELDAAEARIGMLQQDQKGLQQELAQASEVLAQEDPKKELRNTPGATPEAVDGLQKELAATAARNKKFDPQLAGLDQKIKEAKAELNRLKVDPKFKVKGGTGTGFEPRYIECTKRGIVIHPVRRANDILDLKRFPKDKIQFRQYIDQVKRENRQRRIDKQKAKNAVFLAGNPAEKQAAEKKLKAIRELHVVMLIRPSGVENFSHARAIAVTNGIKPGLLPIPTDDQELDLDTDE
jgi:peptidoglycan hydrolase CwlO-like protein